MWSMADDELPDDISSIEYEYHPMPPRSTRTMKVRYVYVGRGKPMPLGLEDEPRESTLAADL